MTLTAALILVAILILQAFQIRKLKRDVSHLKLAEEQFDGLIGTLLWRTEGLGPNETRS
jgi:hypothetical protein